MQKILYFIILINFSLGDLLCSGMTRDLKYIPNGAYVCYNYTSCLSTIKSLYNYYPQTTYVAILPFTLAECVFDCVDDRCWDGEWMFNGLDQDLNIVPDTKYYTEELTDGLAYECLRMQFNQNITQVLVQDMMIK